MISALLLAVVVQAPPVVLADGPSREVIVVAGERAYRVLTVQIVSPGPVAPDPLPPPSPPGPAPEPITGLAALARGVAAKLPPGVADKAAAVFEGIAAQASAGIYATIPDLNAAHRTAMVAALGETDAAAFRNASKPLSDALAADTAIRTPQDAAERWREIAKGLRAR